VGSRFESRKKGRRKRSWWTAVNVLKRQYGRARVIFDQGAKAEKTRGKKELRQAISSRGGGGKGKGSVKISKTEAGAEGKRKHAVGEKDNGERKTKNWATQSTFRRGVRKKRKKVKDIEETVPLATCSIGGRGGYGNLAIRGRSGRMLFVNLESG